MQVKTGVKKDGSITGMHFESYLDGGAYGSYGVASTFYTGALQTVTYKGRHYELRGARHFTNKAASGPPRSRASRSRCSSTRSRVTSASTPRRSAATTSRPRTR